MNTSHRFTALVLLVFFLLPACGHTVKDAPTQSSNFIRLSPSPPPPLPYDPLQTTDQPTLFIWHPGYWDYSGNSFSWVQGTLMPRPIPSATWSPEHWEKREYGWAFVAGYWQ